MRYKKGQSSVEYLSTYAWAFLGLIITIGTLNYFGIFNPSGYTPEQCESGSQIGCEDVALYTNTTTGDVTMLLMIKNNYPRIITIKNISMKGNTITMLSAQEDLVIDPGRTGTFSFAANVKMTPGQKEQMNFIITYHRYTGTIEHTIAGMSIVSVQELPTALPYCGNGIEETGEDCDPPNADDYIIPSSWTCRSDCTTI